MRGGALLLVLTVAAVTAGCDPPRPVGAPTLPVVVGAGNGPVRLGLDQVELLDDGARATARLVAAIRRARGTVHAEIYELDREELVSALAEARHRGVEVDVVADPSVAGNAEALTRLREAGGDGA